MSDQFLWVIFPYVCMAVFIVGHIFRYRNDQFGWTAKSSEFIEKKQLMIGSLLFHIGIIPVIARPCCRSWYSERMDARSWYQ